MNPTNISTDDEVSHWAWFTLCGPKSPGEQYPHPPLVETELFWSPADPHAVTVTFHAKRRPVSWTFDRSLLVEGLRGLVGGGDVQVAPSPDVLDCIDLWLESPSGSAVFRTNAGVIREFRDATRAADSVDDLPGLDEWLRDVTP